MKNLAAINDVADSWNATNIFVASSVAQSVILDEYANDLPSALMTIDEVIEKFPEDAVAKRQRAKVLHNRGEYSDALDIIRQSETQTTLDLWIMFLCSGKRRVRQI